VQKSYEIIEIFEVYEYAVTQYDPQTGQGGLFVEYVDTFLKLKTEASGYQDWVLTPVEDDRYISYFQTSEGIRLDIEAIRPNAAKRGEVKICLNAIWGKLTERNNRAKSKMISDPHELYSFLANSCIEFANLMFVSDDVVWASWRFMAEEQIPSLRHTNEVIGAYVTAGSRLHLYSYLDRLQERAQYCDTDSIMFVQPRDEPALVEIEDNPGAMTSELKPSQFIEEYVSCGTKTMPTK